MDTVYYLRYVYFMETIQPNKTKTINNYDVLDCDKNGRFQCPKVYNWFFIIWAISRLVFISIIWCCFAILCDLFGYEVLLVECDRPVQLSHYFGIQRISVVSRNRIALHVKTVLGELGISVFVIRVVFLPVE